MSRAMPPKSSSAMRRYQQRFWPLMAGYAVLVFGVAFLVKHARPPAPWLYVAAVLPALPLLGVIAVIGLYVHEEADEFRRATYVQGMLWSLGLVLAFTTVWGFLELLANAPHLELWWIFPIYCVGQGVAHHLVRRWYR